MEYDKVCIGQTETIVWNFNDSVDPVEKERTRRKKIKEILGKDMKDIPMLDTRKNGGSKEYCDAIVYTENVQQWENKFTGEYEKNDYKTSDKRIISGGYQIQWMKDEAIEITLSVYKNKLMLQPGRPYSLRRWLDIFGKLKEEENQAKAGNNGNSSDTRKPDESNAGKDAENAVEDEWLKLDMSDIWEDDGPGDDDITAVKQRIQESQPVEKVINVDDDGEVLENGVWQDAENVTPKKNRSRTPKKSTRPAASIKSEFGRLNRILFAMNDQAVKRHEELINMEKRMTERIGNVEKGLLKVEEDLKSNVMKNKELLQKLGGVTTEVCNMKVSIGNFESQMEAHRDELNNAKQNFKFDKKSFTNETDEKIATAERKTQERLMTNDEQIKKLNSKIDSCESKIQLLQSRPAITPVQQTPAGKEVPPLDKEVLERPNEVEEKFKEMARPKEPDIQVPQVKKIHGGEKNAFVKSGIKQEVDSRFQGFKHQD